jgi:hypothetical protein
MSNTTTAISLQTLTSATGNTATQYALVPPVLLVVDANSAARTTVSRTVAVNVGQEITQPLPSVTIPGAPIGEYDELMTYALRDASFRGFAAEDNV